jgi:hypothetical protein
MRVILLAGVAALLALAASSASAQPHGLQKDGTWALPDIGRFHGYIGRGNLMPKCNPWVSPECARLYPTLFNKVPRPR